MIAGPNLKIGETTFFMAHLKNRFNPFTCAYKIYYISALKVVHLTTRPRVYLYRIYFVYININLYTLMLYNVEGGGTRRTLFKSRTDCIFIAWWRSFSAVWNEVYVYNMNEMLCGMVYAQTNSCLLMVKTKPQKSFWILVRIYLLVWGWAWWG